MRGKIARYTNNNSMSEYITFDYLTKPPYTNDDQIAMSAVLAKAFPLLGKVSMWSVLDLNYCVHDLYAKNIVYVHVDGGEYKDDYSISIADELWHNGFNAYPNPNMFEYQKFCRFNKEGDLVIVRPDYGASWRERLMGETISSCLSKYNIHMACETLFPEKTS